MDFAPTFASQKTIIRAREGRAIRSTWHPNFDYEFILNKVPFHILHLPFNSYKVPISSSLVSSWPILLDSAFCIPDSNCGYGQRHSQDTQLLKRKKC